MSLIILLALGGISGAVLIVAAMLMLRVADTDVLLTSRYKAARGDWTLPEAVQGKPKAGPDMVLGIKHAVGELGSVVMQSGIVPVRTRSQLQQTLVAAGFRGAGALPLFVGTKLSMLSGLPLAAWMFTRNMGIDGIVALSIIAAAGVLGMIAPDMIIQRMRLRYLKKVEKGLSDALDLLVICAQAGLSLEPAMARVAVELRGVHLEMCLELELTVRELEIMADSAKALSNFSQRTGLESVGRLTSTLTQTLQYGTPLSEALRTLSNEMRTAMLTAFEERAARLPVMLTLPMILFILPTVFMVVGGPAAIQIIKSLSG